MLCLEMIQAVEKVTVCVSRKWVGQDSTLEQYNPKPKNLKIATNPTRPLRAVLGVDTGELNISFRTENICA